MTYIRNRRNAPISPGRLAGRIFVEFEPTFRLIIIDPASKRPRRPAAGPIQHFRLGDEDIETDGALHRARQVVVQNASSGN